MKHLENFSSQINEQLKRRTIDVNINKFDLLKYKKEGLTPYYLNLEYGDKFGIFEANNLPLTIRKHTNFVEIYFLTNEEFNKIKVICENIKELVKLSLERNKLLVSTIPAILGEIILKEDKKQ